ncbi:MAG: FAD-binding protein [Gammaproteobacteria bacterium]|nr:FAD-binding protein [Gammaproteobacteria bacterium]
MTRDLSWGRYPEVTQSLYTLRWQDDTWPSLAQSSLLAHGQGRSYGDVALNDAGVLLMTGAMDRFIAFDREAGILRCEAGVTLAAILNLIVPHGWFLPVTPGTKFVSVGGAVANDVHGKNHHQAGTFGCYVTQLGLRRSDESLLICSAEQNAELFDATIGGLGLTGLIVWVEFRLKKINGPFIEQETERFANLEQFFALSEAAAAEWEYTVAWVDCLAKGAQLGRGLFFRGNHATTTKTTSTAADYGRTRLNMPFTFPGFVLNHSSINLFNQVFYHRPRRVRARVHFDPFFYPLDKIANWNRMYGKRGFFQYQCVIPGERAQAAMTNMLQTIAQSGQGSFLSVLKVFGDIASPGMLSFPRPGVTLALDFANRGDKTRALLARLDEITASEGGAVYPAKDACMSASHFQQYYPQWQQFAQYIDPAFSSSFWRRVTQQGKTA